MSQLTKAAAPSPPMTSLFQIGHHRCRVSDLRRWAMLLAALILFELVAAASAGEPQVDPALLAAAQKAMPREVTTNELVRGLQAGLWNSNRTAVAVSISQPKPKASVIF